MLTTKVSKILIADAEKPTAKLIEKALASPEYKTKSVCDGNTCLAMLLEFEFDLVILNLSLPKRSGFLILEYIRCNTDLTLPIIALVEKHSSRHEQLANLLEVDAYIRKPLNVEAICKTVEQKIAQHLSRRH